MFPKNHITSAQKKLKDFPLLPNTYPADSRRSSNDSEINDGSGKHTESDGDSDNKIMNIGTETFSNVVKNSTEVKTIKPPVTVVDNDAYGMMGLLNCIRTTDTNANLVALAMGMNLNELGLNLHAHDTLYSTFSGPFSEHPCRIQDVDYHVPPEYRVNIFIRDTLGAMSLEKLKDDAIFFLFYGSVGDYIQLACAAELYNRNWRYHIDERVWLTRVPGFTNYRQIGTIEKGTFYYFDTKIWRRVSREFEFTADKIEKCLILNAVVHPK